jgi:hypothetical protein
MKFCRYSSVQTTGIGESFTKLNILQAERTAEEEEEEKELRRRTFLGEIPVKFEASLGRGGGWGGTGW